MNTLGSRIRKTLLWLLVPAVALCGYLFGYVTTERQAPPYGLVTQAKDWVRYESGIRQLHARLFGREREGRWRPLDSESIAARGLSAEERETLASLGYLSGYEDAPDRTGVTVYDKTRAFPGYNLQTSGHDTEALLLDMDGKVVHRWSCPFQVAFPNYDLRDLHLLYPPEFFRRAHVFDNGDLLAIYEDAGLVKLDKDSNILWTYPGSPHHDFDIDENGNIYVLTLDLRRIPRLHPHRSSIEEFIAILDAEGRELRKVSLLEAFENSPYASLLERCPDFGDIFHTNTVERLSGIHADRSPAFRAGNVLISVREIDTIAIVDLEAEAVVWALTGQWSRQHQPTLLENGNLLLFDNRGHFGMSKVIEFDPFTQEILWEYAGTPENGFYSKACGSSERLPNGNTLITESNGGRTFEVTAEGEIVWEHFNPYRTGENGELIATLFETVRISPDDIGWLPTE